ncbi:hypothetical protein [Bhargavaea massiliensis]|uniref:hypothetical protein n=1 Tax=Bhargavaea massiliensis TaxID=2697500 RepID=UPI001BCC90EA|nr:hypothetical protein [Bhargavaea massiliensis]
MNNNNNNQNSAFIPVALILLIAAILFLNVVLPALSFRWMMVIIIHRQGSAGRTTVRNRLAGSRTRGTNRTEEAGW